MGTNKIKGIYKGFKYITQIFVVKERELEIGYPTDVKHVAHIGWDGASGNPPSWMSEYKTAPEFSTSKAFNGGNGGIIPRESNFSPWSSQDFSESMGLHQLPESRVLDQNIPNSHPPSIPKKQKRKKKTSSSSSISLSPPNGSSATSSSLSKTFRSSKTKAMYHHELDYPTVNVQA
ncbi:CRIB domain-containing protein RIC10 [Linum perenne]